MKKILFLLLLSVLSIVGYGQLATKLIAGNNITLQQAGNTYTVNAVATATVLPTSSTFSTVLTNGSNGNNIPITQLGNITNTNSNFETVVTQVPAYWQAHASDLSNAKSTVDITTDCQDTTAPNLLLQCYHYQLTNAKTKFTEMNFLQNALTIKCAPANQLFPGLQYEATTSTIVRTNQTSTSILDRAANDARYQQIGSFSGILPLANGGTNNTVGASTISAITNDATTNATMYPVWVTTSSGNQAIKTSSGTLSWNPSQKRLNIDASNSTTTPIFSEHLTIHDTLTDSPAVTLARSGYSPSANGDGGTGWAVARSRGTTASPVAVEDNDEIGTLSFSAYSGVAANSGWGTNRGHITCLVDGVRTPGTEPPGRLNFWTAPDNSTETLRMTILGNGKVGIGTFPNIFTPRNYVNWRLSVLANSGDGIGLNNLNSDASAVILNFDKKRTTSIVQSADALGLIQARGYDGSSYQNSSQINFAVDGTPGAGSMPGRIEFYTSSTSSVTPTERMRIDALGNIGIGVTPTVRVHANANLNNNNARFYMKNTNSGTAAESQFYLTNDDAGSECKLSLTSTGFTPAGLYVAQQPRLEMYSGNNATCLIDVASNSKLSIATNATERMSISSGGTVSLTGLTTNGGVITTGGAGALSIAPITNSTYTFALGNTTNISASGNGTAHYYRYGDMVQVQGTFTFTLTTTLLFTEASIPLPINTLVNFSTNYMGSGQGTAQNTGTGAVGSRAVMYSPVSSSQFMWIDWDSQTPTTVETMRFNFVYYLQ